MSYILDALRRADAERERGAVPGIHAQPVPPVSLDGGGRRGGVPVAWVAAGGAVVVAGALAWQLVQDRSIPAAPVAGPVAAAPSPAAWTAPAPAAPAAPAAVAPHTAPNAAPTAPAPVPGARSPAVPAPASPATVAGPVRSTLEASATAAPPARTAGPRPAPAAQPPARREASAGPAVPRHPAAGPAAEAPGTYAPLPTLPAEPTPAGGTAPTAAPSRVAAAPAGATASPAPRAAAAPPQAGAQRVLRIDELPPDVRNRLPQLSIGGSRYSPDPTKRFLIVNGQLLREKEPVTPDVTLEEIRLKAAVLRIGDWRYAISY